MPIRVLILTSDTGFGHRVASEAVIAALDQVHPGGSQPILLNPLTDPRTPFFFRSPQYEYDKNVRENPLVYQLGYRISEIRPVSWGIENAAGLLLSGQISEMLRQNQPDAIISTYLLLNAPLKKALAEFTPRIPSFNIVTELLDVHPMWFASCPEINFVANDQVRDQALGLGIPADQLVVSGIPVHPNFGGEQRSQDVIRRTLGWELDLPVILFVGSRRMSNLVSNLQALNDSQLHVQAAVVAGGDDDAFHQLQMVDWHLPVHLYNYVDNMPSLMRAANVLVTKAGGLVTAEALACSLPVIFIGYIPGQETGNLAYVQRQQAGVAASTPIELVRTLDRWLCNDRAELERFAQNSRRLGKPQAAEQIAKVIIDAVGK